MPPTTQEKSIPFNEEQTTPLAQEQRRWLQYENFKIIHLLVVPFKIYFKQFLKFYIISLIVELSLFGLLTPILFNFEYNFAFRLFIVELDFVSDLAAAFFVPIILLITLLVTIRMAIFSNLTWKTAERGKANVFRAIDNTLKQFRSLIIAAILVLFYLLFIAGSLALAVVMQPSIPSLAWFIIGFLFLMLAVLGSRFCLIVPSITVNNNSGGDAFQDSWILTKGLNWLKAANIFMLYLCISLLLPAVLSQTVSRIADFWGKFGMVFAKALLYPLFDVALTITYLNIDSQLLLEAKFREDIKKRQLQQ